MIGIGRRPIGWRVLAAAVLGGVIAGGSGCQAKMTAPRVTDAAEPVLSEVWVDGSASPGGTGSSDHPHRDLRSALAPGALIHLAAGIYPGPIVLPEGAALISKGGTGVIALEGPGTVITAGRGRLEGISIQGGEVGLSVKGRLTSKGLHFSGQRRLGAQVESTGTWTAEELLVVGVLPDVDGVLALAGAKVRLSGAKFQGSLRRAVDARDAEVELVGVASVGVKEQLHQVGGRAHVEASSAAQGSGPAWFVAAGSLTADRLTVQGHEYAVLSGDRAEVSISNLDARAPQLAALGLVLSKVVVTSSRLEGGSFAALQLLECESKVSDVDIFAARAAGVVVRQGKAELERVTVHEVALDGDTDGHGFHLRGGEVTLRKCLVQNAAGAAVFASAAARVHIFGLGSEHCRAGAVVAELRSAVDAQSVVVKDPGGPALSVPDASSLNVSDLVLSGVEVPVWAECEAGAQVSISGIRGAAPWEPSSCVHLRKR